MDVWSFTTSFMEATVKHVVSWGEKRFDYIAQLPRKGKKNHEEADLAKS